MAIEPAPSASLQIVYRRHGAERESADFIFGKTAVT